MHLKYGKVTLFILLSALSAHQVESASPTITEILDITQIVGGLGIAGICIYPLYATPKKELHTLDIFAFTGIALYSAFVAGHTIYKNYFEQPSCPTCTTRQSKQKKSHG